jgi:DNA-binding transcriptional LysR family regulator
MSSVKFLADPTAGEVRVGTTPILAAGVVSTLIARLSRRYPRIVFRVTTGYVDALHHELTERKLDLLIVRSPGPITDDGLTFELLFEDKYVVAAGAKNPCARRRKIEILELMNQAWVLPPPESVIGSIILEAFRANGLDYPRASVVTDSPHMRLSLLETGSFITVFPASALNYLSRTSALKVLPVELLTACRPNGIVTLKERAVSPVAQLFIDIARELTMSTAGA